MFNWFNTSITRKISGLSVIYLSFIFIVIVYSAIKLQQISHEMREMANIDVPLTEVISNVEVLQLKEHILIEKIRLKGPSFFTDSMEHDKSLGAFERFNHDLSKLLNKSMNTLETALKHGNIRISIEEHQHLISQIRNLHIERTRYENLVMQFFAQGSQGFSMSWNELEAQTQLLDEQTERLMRDINALTLSITLYIQDQEQEFMIVNMILGILALSIGVYLTIFIVQSFRERVGVIHSQLEALSQAAKSNGKDMRKGAVGELDVLETDLNTLVGQISKERDNRYEVERQLIELATRDKLTGAYNRHKWDEQLQELLAMGARGTMFSLVIIDVDFFKKVNDQYGHDVGDNVLQTLAKQLTSRIRQTDMLFRIGGEEFAILFKETTLDAAHGVGEELRSAIENTAFETCKKVTISLGVTCYQEHDTESSIVKRADLLLYKAKEAGRNRVMLG